MAVNLLDTAKSYLTDAVISRVSSSLNENPENTQQALKGAIPIFLSGLLSRGGNPDGPDMLTGLLQQFVTSQATASPETDRDDPDTMAQQGNGLVNKVFGPSAGLVNGALARFSGVSSESASGVMAIAGSIVTGLLGRQLMGESGGINAGSLMALLASQREAVMAALPAPLAALLGNIPGMGALGNVGGAAGSAMTGAMGAMKGLTGRSKSDISDAAGTPVPAHGDASVRPSASDGDRSKGYTFWPWILAAATIALLVFLLRGCGNQPNTVTSTSNDTTSASAQDATANMDSAAASAGALVDSASTSIAAAADSAGAALAGAANSLGAFGAKKLPDGVELNIPANGIENNLLAFIEDTTKPVDKTTWFNFDRLLYETGSAKLKPESREQLQNIAAILKAYPAVNLKVGGYTDNTGNAASNKKLSQSRAESAVGELVRLGVAPVRLEAEGYGQALPVATNSTEAGRAQNRRTAARVTKK